MKRIVMFSGGAASWAAARRVADQYGTADLTLLFANTNTEDADLYRFVLEAAADVGGSFEELNDGRDIWQVFSEARFLGNTRADVCSRVLKREPTRQWVEANCAQDATVLYLGYDWTEYNRFQRTQAAWPGWQVEAPMCERPYQTKPQMLAALSARGIEPPRLYAMGFQHNNCGGFCVKGGHAQFAHLLRVMPQRYAYHEAQEETLRAQLGKNITILRDRTGGETKPLTLRQFRERVEAHPDSIDMLDWGGCGCFVDEAS